MNTERILLMSQLNKTALGHTSYVKKIGIIALLLAVTLAGLFLGAYLNGRFKNKTFRATFVSRMPVEFYTA
jgi:uncharacterized membrane protein YfcA